MNNFYLSSFIHIICDYHLFFHDYTFAESTRSKISHTNISTQCVIFQIAIHFWRFNAKSLFQLQNRPFYHSRCSLRFNTFYIVSGKFSLDATKIYEFDSEKSPLIIVFKPPLIDSLDSDPKDEEILSKSAHSPSPN